MTRTYRFAHVPLGRGVFETLQMVLLDAQGRIREAYPAVFLSEEAHDAAVATARAAEMELMA